MNQISPTSHADVNAILNILLTNVKDILQSQFVGMYLFGSLANGDFDQFSDVDVLIVTDVEISNDTFSALQNMHSEIARLDSPWAIQQEISYLPKDALRRFDPPNNKHPHLDRGVNETLHLMTHESDWIVQRYILRERGVVVEGPDPKTLIDPISPDDLRGAVANLLPLWTRLFFENPSRIDKRGYQSYCVLSLCRMLYTLKYGKIVSKRIAANWAKEHIDSKWTPLIERALIDRQNPELDARPEDINGTLNMMRYTLEQIKPTPYPDVNEVLNLLLLNAKEILGDQFVGMYLYGSLSSGDFNTETSDIDFLVVTTGKLSQEMISKLENMHKQTWAASLKRAGKLEGAYVPKELIRRHDPKGAPCPTVNEGHFYVAGLGSDWIIQRHVVREFGVVLEGPDPKTLIDFVSPYDIRSAVLGILHEWWFPMLSDPAWLRDHESVYRAFAVITMCRVMHASKHGTVVSKPKAARWAQTKLDDRWKNLIQRSVAASQHEEVEIPLNETLDFIRFTRLQVLKQDPVHDK
jgi:predicted nucleotidyltransferase